MVNPPQQGAGTIKRQKVVNRRRQKRQNEAGRINQRRCKLLPLACSIGCQQDCCRYRKSQTQHVDRAIGESVSGWVRISHDTNLALDYVIPMFDPV